MRLLVWLFFLIPAFAQPFLLDESFPSGSGPDNYPRALAVQADQRIIVAGNFTSFNGQATGPLVRLLPNGLLDPEFRPAAFLGSSTPQLTRAHLLSNGNILVQGLFTNVGGKGLTNIAVLRGDGSLETNFSVPPFLPRTASIGTFYPARDGGFWVTGSFTNLGGLTANRLAKVRADGSVDATFRSPFAPNDSSSRTVLPLPDGRIIISGMFSNVAGVSVPGIVRLLATGEVDNSFRSDLPDGVRLSRIVRMPNGSLVGAVSRGAQEVVFDEPATLMRLHPDGQIDHSFRPAFGYSETFTSIYNRILLLYPEPNGNLLVAGTFLKIDGRERPGLARLLPDGSLDACFDPGLGPSGFLLSIAEQADGQIVISGVFRAVEGQNRPYLVRLRPQSDCGPGRFSFASAEFVANESSPSALITVIREGSVALTESGRVAATDASATAEDYQAGTHELVFPSGVRAATISVPLRADTKAEGDEIVQLTLILTNGLSAGVTNATLRIADQANIGSGEADSEFRPGVDAPVTAAAVTASGDWLLGVMATNSGGYMGFNVASLRRIGAGGLLDSGFATNLFDGHIASVVVLPDGRFLVGGFFERVNGLLRPGLARFDAAGNPDLNFSPFAGHISPTDRSSPFVTEIILPGDGSIVCAGELPEKNGSIFGVRLFRIKPDGTLDETFHARQERQSNPVYSAALLPDGSYVAGFLGESAVLARFTAASDRDPRFIPPPYFPPYAESVAVLPDGSIAASGAPGFGTGLVRPTLARVARNGGTITPFHLNASASFDLGASTVMRVLAQNDGRLLAAGTFQHGQDRSITTVVRLNSDGTWDPSFDAGTGAIPRRATSGSDEIQPEIRVLKPFPGGGWLVGGDFAAFGSSPRPFLARLRPLSLRASAFRLAMNNREVPESAGTVWIDVARTGAAETSATVRVASIAESAVPTVDFQPVDEVLTFAPGEWLKRVAITVSSNNISTGNRSFRVALSGTNAPLADPSFTRVTILEDDVNVEFISGEFTAIEGDPHVRIGVRRSGVPGEAVSVVVESDFGSSLVQFSGTQLDSITNYVLLPVRDDNRFEPNAESFVRLTLLEGDATYGLRSTAILRTIENDFPQSPGRGAAGAVNVVIPAPNGSVYVAGGFTAIHGVLRARVARLSPNGEVDPAFNANPGPDAAVTAMTLDSEGRVLIGGDFEFVNGEPRRQVARLRPDGTLDSGFNVGSGPVGANEILTNYPPKILAFATNADGSIFVGGRFTSFQGHLGDSIVRLRPSGAVDPTFHSELTAYYYSGNLGRSPSESGGPSTVAEIHHRTNGALALVGDLYRLSQSGFFAIYEVSSALGMTAEGRIDTNFMNHGINSPVSTLLPLPDGGWLAGTTFSRSDRTRPASGTNWVAIRRLESDGRFDSNFVARGLPNTNFPGSVVRRIQLDTANRILFLAEVSRSNSFFGLTVLGRLLPDGRWDDSFRLLAATNTSPTVFLPKYPFNDAANEASELQSSASIRGMAQQADGTLVLGGTFAEINAEPRRRLARLDSTGELRGRLKLFVELDGTLRLETAPEVEAPYIIESSRDLIQWQPIATNSTPWIPLSIEPNAQPGEHNYFRAVSTAR